MKAAPSLIALHQPVESQAITALVAHLDTHGIRYCRLDEVILIAHRDLTMTDYRSVIRLARMRELAIVFRPHGIVLRAGLRDNREA